MFCVPFSGSESVSQECRTRYNGILEAAAFISAPISKLDVSRLASKHQCSHSFTLPQESMGRCSRVAGIWPGRAIAPVVAEQDINGPNPSVRTLDVVKQIPKVPIVHFFAPGKPSAQKASGAKRPVRNFEEQLAVLERMQFLRRAVDAPEEPQEIRKFDTDMAEQKEIQHLMTIRRESSNQGVNNPLSSFQDSLEKQFNGVNSSTLPSDHSRRAGLTETEQSAEANVGRNSLVWNEPIMGGCEGLLSKNRVGPGPNESNSLWIKGSEHHKDVPNLTVGNKQLDELRRKRHETDGFPLRREEINESKLLDSEDLRTWNQILLKQYQDSRAAGPLSDFGSSGSQNETDRQDYDGSEGPSLGEQVRESSVADEMQAKESCVDVSRASRKVPCLRMPMYRTPTPLQRSLSESILYLESLGADCSRLFRDDPMTMKCTVKKLRALVGALERYGLKSNDLGRIFNLCPKILHLKLGRDLKAVTVFLFDEVGLPRKDFGKVIRRCPRLLVSDIQHQLQPTLSFLLTLGYSKMGQVVSNNPTLLSFHVERKLLPKLRYLESLGFSYKEAASMVVRFPAIFNYSVSDNLQPKYDYLVHEIGARNQDLLAFPQYFGYSLETRIRPRYERIAKLDLSLSIQAILKLSDAEFNVRFPPIELNNHLIKMVPALPETDDATEQDCSNESVNFLSSAELSDTQVLVCV